jgi:hypothetical protein
MTTRQQEEVVHRVLYCRELVSRIVSPLAVWRQLNEGGRFFVPHAGAVSRLWRAVVREVVHELWKQEEGDRSVMLFIIHQH